MTDYDHTVDDVIEALADYADERRGTASEMPSEYAKGYARGYYRALLMAGAIAENPEQVE